MCNFCYCFNIFNVWIVSKIKFIKFNVVRIWVIKLGVNILFIIIIFLIKLEVGVV